MRDRGHVGVRDLKQSLSAYLRRVRRGESLVVTDRGEPIARILPTGIPEGLARLMAEGKISWSGRKPTIARRRVRLRGTGPTAAEMIVQEREERAAFLDSLVGSRVSARERPRRRPAERRR